MKLQDFHLELFERPGADQQTTMRELREEASVAATIAPDVAMHTAAETAGWHVLARDMAGRVLGCGSLADGGRIEGIAVREAWRRQGVGSAILGELVARARALGMPEVTLLAPAGALEFCRGAGFTPDPADAGASGTLPHRLHLPSLKPRIEAPPLRDIGSLPAGSRSDVAAARLQLLADARHQLLIYAPALNEDMFSNAAELEQLRRVACSGRAASIRVLLHDAGAAIANDHPLLPLAQRLPTVFQIRMPTEAADLTYGSAYLLNDSAGYLFLPDARRPAGRAARNHRTAQAPLRQHFSEAWERAERASILNTLDL